MCLLGHVDFIVYGRCCESASSTPPKSTRHTSMMVRPPHTDMLSSNDNVAYVTEFEQFLESLNAHTPKARMTGVQSDRISSPHLHRAIKFRWQRAYHYCGARRSILALLGLTLKVNSVPAAKIFYFPASGEQQPLEALAALIQTHGTTLVLKHLF